MARREAGPEEEQLAKAALGDQAAFEAIVRAWTSRIHAFVLRIVRDRQQAEELTQDVFLKVWRNAAVFDPSRGRASSWMFSIAHNLSVDRLRSLRARGGSVTAVREDLADLATAAPESVGAWERLRMQQALAQLTGPQRQVVELAYFEGLSREEMSEKLGIPVGTAKTRLRDALIKLRGLYQHPGPDLRGLDQAPPSSCSKAEP